MLLTPQEFKTIRAEAGISQQTLSVMLGVSRETITRYETGVLGVPKTIAIIMKVIKSKYIARDVSKMLMNGLD